MAEDSAPLAKEPLYNLLYACQRGQQVAIVSSHDDNNPLREQLYVEQKEDEYVTDFFKDKYENDGELLILTGSAGDGKSALLARGYTTAEQFSEERVNMDATESRSRDQDYSQRLTNFFERIIDDVEQKSGPRSAIAINYGLAVDYFERRGAPEEFNPIWSALQKSQIQPIYESDDENISVINLSHRRTYDIQPDSFGRGLIRDLFDRFDPTNANNLISEAYAHELDNCPAGEDCILRYNISQLTEETTKDQLARMFAGWSVTTGSYLNPRTIIDNISSMLLPGELEELPNHKTCPIGAAIEQGDFQPTESDLLWNSVFDTLGATTDTSASMIDPASRTSFDTDQQTLEWATDESILEQELPELPTIEFSSRAAKIRTILRLRYLENEGGETVLDHEEFKSFLSAMAFFKQEEPPNQLKSRAQDVIQQTRTALSSWTGRQRDDGLVEFVDGVRSTEYRYLSKWNRPEFDPKESRDETRTLTVPGRIKLMAEAPEGVGEYVPIPISFDTYRLITQISEGYTPNATDLDQSHAIKMLHSRLDDFTEKSEQVIIEDRSESHRIIINDEDLEIRVSMEDI